MLEHRGAAQDDRGGFGGGVGTGQPGYRLDVKAGQITALRGNPMTFTGLDYLQQFSIPNFYFHSATAYGLLRHGGVAVGKLDFLGKLA